MAERFTDRLRSLADPIWAAQHEHPFVLGIGDGSLNVEKFKYWVKQDYLFLIDYARMLALGAARAPAVPTMRRFAELTNVILNTEMDLHRSYCLEFGITSDELEQETKMLTTQGYTDFLVRVAATGSFAELVAALLPCMWGFCEIGQRLAERPRPADPRYARWIDMYSSQEFADLAQWCRDLLDSLASGLPEAELHRLEEVFITSSRYEYLFWEMAYKHEEWPV